MGLDKVLLLALHARTGSHPVLSLNFPNNLSYLSEFKAAINLIELNYIKFSKMYEAVCTVLENLFSCGDLC